MIFIFFTILLYILLILFLQTSGIRPMKIAELAIHQNILKALHEHGFLETTPIQEKAIPEILKKKDIFGHSSTGSGKTAAFGVPLLNALQPGKGIQALILTPTRELCVQVTDSLRSFAKYTSIRITSVYGGVGIGPQIDAIKRSDVIVGTPGRILDHLERHTIRFDALRFFVLDEADKMFEMGFLEAVEEIMTHIPKERQTLLFSATLPEGVKHLIKKHLRNPITVRGEVYVDKQFLKQFYIVVQQYDKFSLLLHFLKQNQEDLSLIFCGTRHEVDIVAKNLKLHGIHAMAIHGGLTQSRRLYALEALKKQHISVLVATDVAARGLDIKNVSHVYNYDVPKSSDEYVHRIGRTARAGMSGSAVTLLTERDYGNFNNVLRDRTLEIHKMQMPVIQRVAFQRKTEFGHRQSRRSSFGQRGSGYGSSGHSRPSFGRKSHFERRERR